MTDLSFIYLTLALLAIFFLVCLIDWLIDCFIVLFALETNIFSINNYSIIKGKGRDSSKAHKGLE